MPVVRLIHWNETESQDRVQTLQGGGYTVDYDLPSPELLKTWKRLPPAAFIIDLSRLPSHGRDIAVALRSAKATRQISLVFVGGEESKVERIRELLPDATYSSWRAIRGSLKRALAQGARTPIVPTSQMAGYSQTPLPKKRGIKENSNVVLVRARANIRRTPCGRSFTSSGPRAARSDNLVRAVS